MIAITGGLGFIGSALCVELARTGHQVMAVDRPGAPVRLPSDVQDRVAIVEVDLHQDAAKLDDLVFSEPVDGIVNLAVYHHPGDALETMRGSADMLTALLGLADRNGVGSMIHASSLAVYFGAREAPFTEDLPLSIASSNPVEAIKKLDELILAEVRSAESTMVRATARLGNVYGPGYRSLANPPSQYCHAAVGRMGASSIGPWDGSPFARAVDYVHVFDVARGLAALVSAPQLEHACYNVGGQAAASPGDIARLVERVTGHRFPGSDGAVAASAHHLDTSRIRRELSWAPQYGLEAGVEQYLEWLRAHEY